MICMNLCEQHILLRHEELKERARQLLEQARKDAVRGSAPQPPTSLNISNHPTKVNQKHIFYHPVKCATSHARN